LVEVDGRFAQPDACAADFSGQRAKIPGKSIGGGPPAFTICHLIWPLRLDGGSGF
jgi:hypothetical protein